jgi:hypothetical protein
VRDNGRNEGDDELHASVGVWVWVCCESVTTGRVTSTSRHSRGLSQVRLRLNNAGGCSKTCPAQVGSSVRDRHHKTSGQSGKIDGRSGVLGRVRARRRSAWTSYHCSTSLCHVNVDPLQLLNNLSPTLDVERNTVSTNTVRPITPERTASSDQNLSHRARPLQGVRSRLFSINSLLPPPPPLLYPLHSHRAVSSSHISHNTGQNNTTNHRHQILSLSLSLSPSQDPVRTARFCRTAPLVASAKSRSSLHLHA